MPFQSAIYSKQAPAIEGDFATANPRSSIAAGEGAYVAGPLGVIVGRFARANPANNLVTNADPGVPSRLGFVHRDGQRSLITAFLGQAVTSVLPGTEITLMGAGDYWGRFPVAPVVNQKVYASYLDGTLSAAPTGSPPAGASFTGVIAVTTGVLTASAVTGTIMVGAPISGAGVPAGTIVTGFLSGTLGGAGTYSTNITTAVASTAMTTTGAVETEFRIEVAYGAGELSQFGSKG